MQTPTLLVTGGGGYIGSHAVRMLCAAGHRVMVVDDFSRGHKAAIDRRAAFVRADVNDAKFLAALMRLHAVEAVLHFAGLAYVGESAERAIDYHRVNVGGTIGVLDAMQQAGVRRLVYSSTCATYGIPREVPITEDAPQQPISPYGRSKWFAEQIIRDAVAAHPQIGAIALRYFNVAGCSADGELGEDHSPETHLIPLLIQTALGRRPSFSLFGTDYPTPDGTCIRDYIHVEDLCRAHILALTKIEPGRVSCFNLGLHQGYSVREVIRCVEQVSGAKIRVEEHPRRPGDPPELVAAAELAREQLGWEPQFTSLEPIVASAWRWFRDHPHGYADG